MKISRDEALTRRVDDAVEIVSMFNGKDFPFDLVISKIDGSHPPVVNLVSDRAYFILSGEHQVRVGDTVAEGRPHDLFLIPKGTPHGVTGRGELLIVTSPAFDPANERPAQDG